LNDDDPSALFVLGDFGEVHRDLRRGDADTHAVEDSPRDQLSEPVAGTWTAVPMSHQMLAKKIASRHPILLEIGPAIREPTTHPARKS
jgi:hypothetical protein